MSDPHETCPVCQVGRLHVRATTYSKIHNGLLISVPDTLQWTCDYCRYTTYDRQMMQRIEATIGQIIPANSASRRTTFKGYRPQIPSDKH